MPHETLINNLVALNNLGIGSDAMETIQQAVELIEKFDRVKCLITEIERIKNSEIDPIFFLHAILNDLNEITK